MNKYAISTYRSRKASDVLVGVDGLMSPMSVVYLILIGAHRGIPSMLLAQECQHAKRQWRLRSQYPGFEEAQRARIRQGRHRSQVGPCIQPCGRILAAGTGDFGSSKGIPLSRSLIFCFDDVNDVLEVEICHDCW